MYIVIGWVGVKYGRNSRVVVRMAVKMHGQNWVQFCSPHYHKLILSYSLPCWVVASYCFSNSRRNMLLKLRTGVGWFFLWIVWWPTRFPAEQWLTSNGFLLFLKSCEVLCRSLKRRRKIKLSKFTSHHFDIPKFTGVLCSDQSVLYSTFITVYRWKSVIVSWLVHSD